MRRYPICQCGFSLVELTLALGVAAVSLLVIFALVPTTLRTSQAAFQQTADTSLATAIAADLRSTPVGTTTSTRYQIPIPATGNATHTLFLGDDGKVSGTIDSDAVASQNPIYRATVWFYAPATSQRTATGVRILLTWPALADKTANTAPAKYAGAYEVFTALDRN